MNLLKDLSGDLIGNARKRGLLNDTVSAVHNTLSLLKRSELKEEKPSANASVMN